MDIMENEGFDIIDANEEDEGSDMEQIYNEIGRRNIARRTNWR